MHVTVYCDGAIEPCNPGGHAVGGWVIRASDGGLLIKGAVSLGEGPDKTNNIAEYAAVYGALWRLFEAGIFQYPVRVHTDSQLVVKQLNGEWRCKSKELRWWRDRIWQACENFLESVYFVWIPREENTEADEMSRSLY